MEQKGGIEGRQMTDVTRNLDLIRDHNDEGYLVCLDQAKAFDRVNHTYLFEVMKKVGINGNFLKAVQELYKNITSQIQLNGGKTEKIQIERGVRQGCPLSMTLYTISAIPVIEMVKDNSNIKGHTTKHNNKI